MMDLQFTNDGFFDILPMLAVDGSNKVLRTIDNFVTIFQNDVRLKDCLAYNELYGTAENLITGKRWEEADDSIVMSYIEKKYKIRHTESYYNAFNIVCYNHAYNPIKTILESNVWDGVHRIDNIFQTYLKCEDTPYIKEIARVTFLGGIARLYKSGIKFDNMPIFIGKQGCGKSSFIRWMAIKDNFFKEINEIDGQKGIESLEGAWICEMSELLALTKSKEVEAVKSFITRQYDTYRKPYERRITENPRKCIIIGSTNRSQFLTDKTGNRRFLPIQVNCNGYDIANNEALIRHDLLQCWLEAKYIFDNNNYSLFVNPDILPQIQDKQEEVVEDDWRIGVIEKFLEKKAKTCVKDIWDNALSGEYPKECTKKDSSDIVSIMDNMTNWEKVSCMRFDEYGRQRGWKRSAKVSVDTNLPFPTDKTNDELPY